MEISDNHPINNSGSLKWDDCAMILLAAALFLVVVGGNGWFFGIKYLTDTHDKAYFEGTTAGTAAGTAAGTTAGYAAGYAAAQALFFEDEDMRAKSERVTIWRRCEYAAVAHRARGTCGMR